MYWNENIGCFVSENLLPDEGEILGTGAEDRQKKTDKAAEETASGLFEDIGRYFHISSQAEQVETQDEASSVERLAACQEGISPQRHTRVALYEKDLCKVFER